MWVSWRWLSQWVDTQGVDPQAFAQRFTCTVAEIDSVVRWGFGLDAVVVADVIAVQPHPNADKLRLATVDLGDRQLTVVCGAPDLRVGMRVPFVPVGITLPSGIVVKDGHVRGVPSPGMLASEADLGLSDHHDGLLSLDGVTAAAGTSLPQAFELQDVLYEVDNKSITHRPDLWGQYGMAREVAAMLGVPLRPLDTEVVLGHGAPLQVQVQAPAACFRYVCARISEIAVAPSPVALRLRLRRLGVRPINNVVDATNLVMLETGNPLHAFDARHLDGRLIAVRYAQAGETMVTLDGQARTLTPDDVVITDGHQPVALAGIMGGQNSEIAADTRELVLEAAAFDAATIRKTAMRLGMRSESSARFEKALDPHLPTTAARRFVQVLQAVCPTAVVTSDLTSTGPHCVDPPAGHTLATTTGYLRTRLGLTPAEMSDSWMVQCLRRLAFAVECSADGALTVGVPTFRATKDVRIAEDIVEELGRHYGYGRIASAAPLIASRPPFTSPSRLAERVVRQALVLQEGLTEDVLYAFDHEGQRTRLGLHEHGAPRLGVRNEISTEHCRLRRNLAPNLVATAEQNLQHGDGKEAPREGFAVQIFELGQVVVPAPSRAAASANELAHLDPGVPPLALDPQRQLERDGWFALMDADMVAAVQATVVADRPLPWQPLRLGVVCAERLGGGAEGSKRVVPDRSVSQRVFAQAVSALNSAVRALGKAALHIVPADDPSSKGGQPQEAGLVQTSSWTPDWHTSWRHPRRSARLVAADGATVGVVSLVHPDVRNRLQVAAELAIAELDLQAIMALPDRPLVGLAPAKLAANALDVTGQLRPGVRQDQALNAVRVAVQAANLPVETVDYLYEAALPGDKVVPPGNQTGLPAAATRAVTFRLLCRAGDRSLIAADLAKIQQVAFEALAPFGPPPAAPAGPA
ncbi:MAG: phenylalanine--tRNA ligase subunit beta [Myxococcales bacterium]|nr:phenylalanine--tRNA ligase subunit beta [Myxococcales bacterium]